MHAETFPLMKFSRKCSISARNVFAPLAQRRDDEMNDVDAIEQILAKLPLADELAQVAIRRGDDADIRRHRHALGADLLDFARLEEPQQQALHPQRHLADFVEEDGAVRRHLELCRACRDTRR